MSRELFQASPISLSAVDANWQLYFLEWIYLNGFSNFVVLNADQFEQKQHTFQEVSDLNHLAASLVSQWQTVNNRCRCGINIYSTV